MRQKPRASGMQAVFVSRILMIALAVILLPALAADPSSRGILKGNPRLANLKIEIWPEYDRPAALVILQGELAANVALPAAVSLRIATSSRGPTAVAASTGLGTELFNIKYERKDADDFITLNFEVPQRVFHVEFYEPLVTNTPERSYTYVWPGDLAIDRLNVILQEPTGARDLSVEPALDAIGTGQDGLRYRSAELGAREAGKQLPIKIRYTKPDSRTSAEILQPATPNSPPVPATGFGDKSRWALILAIAAALVSGAGAAFLWWQGRRKISGTQSKGSGFCSQCGTKPASGDRFCSKCGTPLGKN